MDFAFPDDHKLKLKESKKNDKYHVFAKELKMIIVAIVIGVSVQSLKIDTKPGGLRNNATNGDHQNYYIIEIYQNTEKSPGNLKKLAVIQTSVKDHQR